MKVDLDDTWSARVRLVLLTECNGIQSCNDSRQNEKDVRCLGVPAAGLGDVRSSLVQYSLGEDKDVSDHGDAQPQPINHHRDATLSSELP